MTLLMCLLTVLGSAPAIRARNHSKVAGQFRTVQNANDVFSIAELHKHTNVVKYLGDFNAVEGCENACVEYSFNHTTAGCISFTWHQPNFATHVWQKGCYGVVTNHWELHTEQAVITGTTLPPNPPPTPPAPPSGCSSDAECNYNGACVNRECVCDRAWWGGQCATLTLQPSNKSLGYHGFVNGSRASSWGGSIIIGDDGTYHMYAAEITGSCGMNVWLANSQVIHATSPNPLTTPFVREPDAVVAEVFAHEPIARRAPTGEYVVWYTAVLPPLLPPVNGGQRCRGCYNGTSPAECGTDANRNATTNLPTYMVWSTSSSGPWSTPVEIPNTNVFADSNFAPVINNNGSLVALMRKSVITTNRVDTGFINPCIHLHVLLKYDPGGGDTLEGGVVVSSCWELARSWPPLLFGGWRRVDCGLESRL